MIMFATGEQPKFVKDIKRMDETPKEISIRY